MAKGKTAGSKSNTSALEKAVQKALLALRGARKDLKSQGLASFTPDERLHSTGRLRDGEDAAMTAVLDTIDAHPALFVALAARDHGKDDKVVETGPARTALARRAILAPLAAELGALLTELSDDMLASGELAKDVTVPAYGIIKANAPVSPEVRRSAAPAIGFYAKAAKRGAKSAKNGKSAKQEGASAPNG